MASLVNKGELNGFSPAISSVRQNGQDSLSVSSIIEQFKNSGGILEGKIWQKEGANLDAYMNAMNKSMNTANKLSNAISESINSLLAVWDSRFSDDFSDTYRDETVANLEEAIRALERCQAYLDSLPEDSPHRGSAIAARDAAQDVVNEWQSLLDAIDVFLSVYRTVLSNLDSLASELESDFGSYVKGITPSTSWSFTP